MHLPAAKQTKRYRALWRVLAFLLTVVGSIAVSAGTASAFTTTSIVSSSGQSRVVGAETRVGVTTHFSGSSSARLTSESPACVGENLAGYDELALVSCVATKSGGKTEIWRAVEPEELADLIGSGKYRPGPGNEGKYFFPTKAQAKNLADNILPGRKFCITSGCVDSSVLAKIDKIYPAGEGQAWFIPNELLPYIDNIVIHGPA